MVLILQNSFLLCSGYLRESEERGRGREGGRGRSDKERDVDKISLY